MELRSLEKKYFATDEDLQPILVTKSKGSFLFDDSGKRFIDFTGGYAVGNFGWANEAVLQAIRTFDGPTYVSPNFEYKPWVELAEILAEITPGKLRKSFRATGGTEAVEIALQAAMVFTGREKFIAVEGAYHGNSIATIGLNDPEAPQAFTTRRIKPPFNEESADKIEKILKNRDIAAIIMEPIILNMTVEVPEQIFFDRIQSMCKKYGTLLIMDEVMTGFGRTGRMFASEHFGIEPDIMCLAKSITGGAAPMGATIMREDVAKKLQEDNFPYSTYGWHPLSVAAAMANINYIQENWLMLDANSRSISEYFWQRLSQMQFKVQPDIRIMGLSIGLKFNDEDYPEKFMKKARKNGLLFTDGVTLFPPLNVEFETAKEALDIIEKSI